MNYAPLIYALRDHERYVYHYTKARTALDYILRNNTLRLNLFTRTNDPRESRRWQFNIGSLSNQGHPLMDRYDTTRLSKWLGGTLQRSARVACFCNDSPPLTGDHLADVNRRGFARPRMWAQYGENHRGVCLVFDRAKLVEAMTAAFRAKAESVILFWAPVEYRNHRQVPPLHEHEFSVTAEDLAQLGKDRYPWKHLRRYWRRLFFEKAEDWSAEREWRAVGFTTARGALDLPLGDALVGVIHGARMSIKTSSAIIAIADRPEIEHMGLTWTNGAPWYDLGNGSWSYNNRRLFERVDAMKAAASNLSEGDAA